MRKNNRHRFLMYDWWNEVYEKMAYIQIFHKTRSFINENENDEFKKMYLNFRGKKK